MNVEYFNYIYMCVYIDVKHRIFLFFLCGSAMFMEKGFRQRAFDTFFLIICRFRVRCGAVLPTGLVGVLFLSRTLHNNVQRVTSHAKKGR